ncbi:MAG TPA: hypothetical protein PLR25_14690 [Planctomycetaceae bacterium]|nr:hypothetical protein [Planctomycetaceae bacterium]
MKEARPMDRSSFYDRGHAQDFTVSRHPPPKAMDFPQVLLQRCPLSSGQDPERAS